ncbi:hypothetical protein PsorP6_012636 [Peronosclerospora sorghi]|uniref:Uncharacterized protein n=1 Tax=Peronosclerospora sorghi TaxID=230839 RepID=A0ACC0WHL0_9STRA|nr:hypothetical protein PsorP6_012636 [Peronosclerospora sorghi]
MKSIGIFTSSPVHNQLVTIYAVSATYWNYQNDFCNDPNLRVRGVPCLLKWLGQRGRTEGMLLQRSLYDELFLRYLFQNPDQPDVLPTPEDRQQKQIRTVQWYTGYQDVVTTYRNERNPVPTFLMMVYGRFEHNRRPCCPYCRYSELPLEYMFYAYAPKHSWMIRVDVTPTYAAWRTAHAILTDPHLHLYLVPLLFSMHQVGGGLNGTPSIQFSPHKARYDELAPLRDLFQSFA